MASHPAFITARAEHCEGKLKDWPEKFLTEYFKLGAKATIAQACRNLQKRGVPLFPALVYARKNPRSSQFSEEFLDRFLVCEGERIAHLEAVHLETVEEEPAFRQKFLERHPYTKDSWGAPPVKMQIDKRETRKLEITKQIRVQVETRSASLVERERKLIEEGVIDVGATEVETARSAGSGGGQGGQGGQGGEAGTGEEEGRSEEAAVVEAVQEEVIEVAS